MKNNPTVNGLAKTGQGGLLLAGTAAAAMAAIGLNTDIVHLVKSGGKPILMGLCCWGGHRRRQPGNAARPWDCGSGHR